MLATRSYDTEQSHWPFGKFYPSSRTPSAAGSRMSDNYDHSLPAQSDWQGPYPYLSQTGTSVYSQQQPQDSSHAAQSMTHAHSGADSETLRLGGLGEGRTTLPIVGQHHPSGVQAGQGAAHMPNPSDGKGDLYGSKTTGHPLNEIMGSGEATDPSAASAQPNSISSLIQSSSSSRGYGADDHHHVSCSKDNADADDEDVIEAEPEAPHTLTTAERVAARRKMKRFRLTHQQTRFLSSEFAKQPHPDAAHRERLSREIPGLSPRQVQVWFQNRRAKIKRHNAEDRERMIKMRAVPDDFDNVQALHSPYGAMNMPMAPSVDFASPSYANSMMRPLMVDVRRQDANDQISPTGIVPPYSNIGYNPPTSMNPSGVISPLSPASSERYTHSSHPASALGGSHGTLDNALQAGRAGMRPIQSFSSIRDVMSRPRSESLQSPLRSGMSWKTESMDYYVYGGLNNSNQTMTDRPSMVYQSSQLGQAASGGIGGLDRSSYSSSSTTHASPGLQYSPFPSVSQNGPRLRAASASSVTLGMDHQYRDISGSGLHSPGHGGHGRPMGASSHYSGSSAYTTSYAPAASATAPLDTSQSRPASTPSNVRDYPDTPLHVGAAPASEFPNIMHAGMGGQENPRSEVRDLYHNGSLEYGSHAHDRSDHYSGDLAAHPPFKRERSYTLSGAQTASVGDTRAQPQGSTA